jgi:hypothetical protein
MHSLDAGRQSADAGFIAKLNSKGAAAMSLNINEIIGFQVESTADWRRAKAQQFPDDGRNLEAAEELDRLANEIAKLEGSDLHRRIVALIDLTNDTAGGDCVYIELNESVSEELRGIGFRGGHESGAALLEWYCEKFESLLREHINSADDDTPSPSLVEQVENNEAVKAAKRAYDEIYAKAYAEARKRL